MEEKEKIKQEIVILKEEIRVLEEMKQKVEKTKIKLDEDCKNACDLVSVMFGNMSFDEYYRRRGL